VLWTHENEDNVVVCEKEIDVREFDYSEKSFKSCKDCWRECVFLVDHRDRVVHSYNIEDGDTE